jgi:tetratricopeptide (TPR) repeat protein
MTAFERRIRRRNALVRAERLLRLAMAEEGAAAVRALEEAWEPLSEALSASSDAAERAEVISAVERLLRGGRESEAAARLRLLIRLHDVAAEGGAEAFALRLALAEVLRLQGDGDGAAAAAREALLCAGSDLGRRREALVVLVEGLLGCSNVREAARWHRLRGEEPEDLRWLLQGARIAARLGDGARAEAFLAKADAVSARTPRGEGECPRVRFHRAQAEVFAALGRLPEAADACEAALAALARAESVPPDAVDLERRLELGEAWADLLERLGDPRAEMLRQELGVLRARLAALRGRHLRPV